jgi:hypothetical protein
VTLEGARVRILDRLSANRPILATLHLHWAARRVRRMAGAGFGARGEGWSLEGNVRNERGKTLAFDEDRAAR